MRDNNLHREIPPAIMAGLLFASMVVAPVVALADNIPSVGDQTGSGKTDLTMILEKTGEYGGTEHNQSTDSFYNPDTDGDTLGDNLAFTVPTSINYVVQADGDLVGPSAGAAFIENRSNFKTHVSSVQVNNNGASGASGFTFVTDIDTDTASNNSTANAVELHFGPAADQLNAASYTSKAAVTTPSAWNMAATNGAHTANSDRGDEVQLTTSGKVARISEDITVQTKFGEIHWYLTPGEASDNVNTELHISYKYMYTNVDPISVDSIDDIFPGSDGQVYGYQITDSATSVPDSNSGVWFENTEFHNSLLQGEEPTWGEFLDAMGLTTDDVNGRVVWLWCNW